MSKVAAQRPTFVVVDGTRHLVDERVNDTDDREPVILCGARWKPPREYGWLQRHFGLFANERDDERDCLFCLQANGDERWATL